MRHLLIWLTAALASAAVAEERRVISPRPDAVSVTIYRDLFAMITETRTVDLPAGPVTLQFDGVVETLIPQSAVITGAGRSLAESNYDFERLTPANLLRHHIGETVTLMRTHRATGKVRQVAATVVAANAEGVVFRTVDGNEALACSGLPEQLTFSEIPGELKATPTLSIQLAAGAAGKREVRVSYIAHGFGWRADYVGQLPSEQPSMDLLGWITLHNLTNATFRDAQVQVIAGRLNLLDAEEERGSGILGNSYDFGIDDQLDYARDAYIAEMREEFEDDGWDVEHFSGCYPFGPGEIEAFDIGVFPDLSVVEAVQREAMGVIDGQELEEVTVTGFRMSMTVRERLADYQLYRLPANTDLLARQSKQVAFLHKPDVKVERFYGVRIASAEESFDALEDFIVANVMIGWRNRESDGLGEPLPSGIVRIFETGPSGLVFAGSDKLRDSPVDTPIELTIGSAVDLALTLDNIDDEPAMSPLALLTRRVSFPLHLRVSNAKSSPVLFELRQGLLDELEDMSVSGASRETQRKSGDYMWRFQVPANGEATLSYKLRGKIHPDEF
ncbi:MAG TPA: hypothetical protein VFO82_09995 [Steroidobacteraceae bacterium]|nr:hypothetical protein [Steroidobacteraceae bacterium]